MPIVEMPKYKATKELAFELPNPAFKGINLNDLEYELDAAQTPYMLNMMYRNGAFSKRYGQAVYKTLASESHAMIVYKGSLIYHTGTSVYKDETEIASGLADQKGLFVKFNQNLYYFCNGLYCYDGTTWSTPAAYIPTVMINRKPDGTSGDRSEAYNMMGTRYRVKYHGDGSSKSYKFFGTNLDHGASDTPTVKVDNEDWTYDPDLSAANTFKYDYETGIFTLKSAAPSGTNNVEITACKTDEEWTGYHNQIMASKYYACFGGDNNSRLFLAGGGKSMYIYSDVFDATYFPYTNYSRVGNSAEDITGFGLQYNVLMVFKPTEIFSLAYYQQTSETTISESEYGVGAFSSQVVNSSVGCDCPNTIQLINNQLTWYSTKDGVCALTSTNIVDERNVRAISINIDRTNNFGLVGVKDIDLYENNTSLKDTVMSVDYEGKYFLVFPKHYVYDEDTSAYVAEDYGNAFVWDYLNTPYSLTSTRTNNPENLAWYLFDNMCVKQFVQFNNQLLYISSIDGKKMVKLDNSFNDIDTSTWQPKAINAYYMTPFLQFGAVEYLKTVKNIYIQCRGDTASTINVYYYTDESETPDEDSEPIRIGGKLWNHFSWDTFEWLRVNFANVFRRKCSLKKVQMVAFFFTNNEIARDMSITHIALQYSIVKYIK